MKLDGSSIHIVTVLGARPQFIKASVVSNAFANDPRFKETLIHTGQHFDANMSDVFFQELGIPTPHFNLGISGGTHGAMTGQMLAEIEKVLLLERPDAVLVYGDTNSTLAGALAAAKLNIPVAHVEAGLRSFNMAMPEEINRILTDRISRWHFTPSEGASIQLASEGIGAETVATVGDVMFDVALHFTTSTNRHSDICERLKLSAKEFILATIHRAENADHAQRLNAIVDALEKVAQHHDVVWPIHPRTRNILREDGRLAQIEQRLMIIDPVGFLDMVNLERNAAVIVTDSGGVQKEAFFHSVPCVTLRDETEWIELVEAGWNRLAPPRSADEIASVIRSAFGTQGLPIAPYGRGDAAQRIVSRLGKDLGA